MTTAFNEGYEANGYVVVDLPGMTPILQRLRTETLEIYDTISRLNDGPPVGCDADVIALHHNNQPLQYMGVKQSWGAPSLFALASQPELIGALHALGIAVPVLEVAPLLRCDMPVKKQSIFKQHQDYPYNIGSTNSATVWIPLQDTGEAEGALLVAPGTHRNGVYPNRAGIITEGFSFDFESVPMALGQALIFNQKLVHQSGVNTSDRIRFSVQIRVSDLTCRDYASRGYPLNHRLTTERYEGEVDLPETSTAA